MKIAISGKSGCGNTSVSRIVAERLGLTLINYTFRNMAQEREISFEEVCRRAEEDSSYDLYLDKRQVELTAAGQCILGSRLAIWLLKDADLKVFLTAPEAVRARRISGRELREFEDALEQTAARDKRDRARYLELYKIDINDFKFADLIIDTQKGDQQWVAGQIIAAARARMP